MANTATSKKWLIKLCRLGGGVTVEQDVVETYLIAYGIQLLDVEGRKAFSGEQIALDETMQTYIREVLTQLNQKDTAVDNKFVARLVREEQKTQWDRPSRMTVQVVYLTKQHETKAAAEAEFLRVMQDVVSGSYRLSTEPKHNIADDWLQTENINRNRALCAEMGITILPKGQNHVEVAKPLP